MKKCKECAEVKPLEEFYKDKRMKDGMESRCNLCCINRAKNNYRTVRGKALQIFSRQKISSKERNLQPPKYTKKEFIDWILSNEEYLKLHSEWVKSGYKKELSPSVDRIDDYKRYSFSNIRVVTWRENNRKSHLDMKNGINNKQNKAVVKMGLNENDIKEYYSIRQAGRETGICYTSIISACNGKYKTAGGFKWKYAERT